MSFDGAAPVAYVKGLYTGNLMDDPALVSACQAYSGGGNGECVEVADGHVGVPVRDSKVPDGAALVFGADGWSAFVGAVKSGTLVA